VRKQLGALLSSGEIAMSITVDPSGFTRLTTTSGVSMVVSTLGARLVELWVPDRDGILGNVVVGLPTAQDYLQRAGLYLGCTVGRVAGRIPHSQFVGSGLSFDVEPNERGNHLHGGVDRSFDRVEWELTTFDSGDVVTAEFHYLSPAGEEGYPGELSVISRYDLSAQGVLTSTLTAHTTAATPVNLTTHAYWNLSGIAGSSITDHQLDVDVATLVETDDVQLPTGKLLPLGKELSLTARSWDDTFVLADVDHLTSAAATLRHSGTGRTLTLYTTEPAMQVYSGAYLPHKELDAEHILTPSGGVCLEPQRIIDNPVLPQFPSIVLQPEETYLHITRHHFTAE
jgi:aldose 1-epimerase